MGLKINGVITWFACGLAWAMFVFTALTLSVIYLGAPYLVINLGAAPVVFVMLFLLSLLMTGLVMIHDRMVRK